ASVAVHSCDPVDSSTPRTAFRVAKYTTPPATVTGVARLVVGNFHSSAPVVVSYAATPSWSPAKTMLASTAGPDGPALPMLLDQRVAPSDCRIAVRLPASVRAYNTPFASATVPVMPPGTLTCQIGLPSCSLRAARSPPLVS